MYQTPLFQLQGQNHRRGEGLKGWKTPPTPIYSRQQYRLVYGS